MIVLQAPMGYGKTVLLNQWRREAQMRGRTVFWINAQEDAHTTTLWTDLVQLLGPQSGLALMTPDMVAGQSPGRAGAFWLGEVAKRSQETLLIIDGIERLSGHSLELLRYLVHHSIPNLSVALGMRPGTDLRLDEAVDYGSIVLIEATRLRFGHAEVMNLMRLRLGDKVDPHLVARLLELSEGWPLGLQLLLRAYESEQGLIEPDALIHSRAQSLVEGVLSRLSREDLDFLVRISVIDLVHPDLCSAVTGSEEGKERLLRLIHSTPIFIINRHEWVRMHRLIREALRSRLHELPHRVQMDVHMRATRWLVEQNMLPEAAWHAHAAGQHALAYDMAEESLHLAVKQGAQENVLRWLDLVPEAELKKRPRLRLATAWALALSQRQGEAAALVKDLPEEGGVDASLRYDSELIASDAAYYGDDIERCQQLLRGWEQRIPTPDNPRLRQMLANRLAALEIALGDPATARYRLHVQSRKQEDPGFRYGEHWQHYFIGLSHLKEGALPSAEAALRPALLAAESEMGRRHHLSCMMAALLATVLYEQGQLDEAAAVLANRLDVLEKVGTPDSVWYAYRTAARLAMVRGEAHKAWELLASLYACGVFRGLSRLSIASLAEQVRLCAHGAATQRCLSLVPRMTALIDSTGKPQSSSWGKQVALHLQISCAYQALCRGGEELQELPRSLQLAQELADGLQAGYEQIVVMALRAHVLELSTQGGGEVLMREALQLAERMGQRRLLADLHPAVADWASRLMVNTVADAETATRGRTAERSPKSMTRLHLNALLTPKEQSVLQLLALSYSNKEIALAMAVSDETVKWHLKNLFGKLEAGSRKHAVRRAELLGLL